MYTLSQNSVLNSYIFEQIFGKLDSVVTQVRMARAFPEYINDAIREWCRWEFTSTVGPSTFMIDCLHVRSDYRYFMRCMAPHFKIFRMFEIGYGTFPKLCNYLLHLRDIGVTSLPYVETCIISGNPDTVNDADLYDLSILMPNVKILMLNANISGEFMACFSKLEELYLFNPFYSITVNPVIMQRICIDMSTLRVLDIRDIDDTDFALQNLQLTNLEILKLNLINLMNILGHVMELSRLRKLCVYYGNSHVTQPPNNKVFEFLLTEKAARITGISINNRILKLGKHWDTNMIKLELPKLHRLVFERWPHAEMFLNGHNYPKQQIEKFGCSFWHCAKVPKLLNIIKEHTGLKELSVHMCNFDIDLLKQIETLLTVESTRNVYGRTIIRPRLYIWNYCNFISKLRPDELLYWNNNKYIELELKNFSEYKLQENSFEFDFE